MEVSGGSNPSLPTMAPHMIDYYPMIIRESRYGGAYSGGRWILTAGLHNPQKHIPSAWGSDIDCMEFWSDKSKPTMLDFSDDKDFRQDEVILHAGNDPTEMVDEVMEFVEDE